MDPHGPGGGPGWGGPAGWAQDGRVRFHLTDLGFLVALTQVPGGPGFGGFFGSCFYLLCCCCCSFYQALSTFTVHTSNSKALSTLYIVVAFHRPGGRETKLQPRSGRSQINTRSVVA